jgi:hypothetical protein
MRIKDSYFTIGIPCNASILKNHAVCMLVVIPYSVKSLSFSLIKSLTRNFMQRIGLLIDKTLLLRCHEGYGYHKSKRLYHERNYI